MDEFDVNLDVNVRKRLFFGKVCEAQKGGDCPECAKATDLFRQSRVQPDQGKKKELEEQARGLYAKSRIFINAINVKDEDKSFPVRIYAIPPLVYDEIISIIRGQRQLNPNHNVFHPLTGQNVLITKRGSGILTRYSSQLDQTQSEIPNKELLVQLQAGDRSGLHNLNRIEDFIADNYMHITTLNNDQNLLRLMPPFEDQTIYKELKFHRFTIGSYQTITADNAPRISPSDPSDNLTGPSFDDRGMQDEFNPAALEDVPDFTSNPIGASDHMNTAQEYSTPEPRDFKPENPIVTAMREDVEKMESGTSKDEAQKILEELRRIKADTMGTA